MALSQDIQNDITKIIATEGGLVDNPADPGGRTFEGLSEKANPDLWKSGPPTPEQVRQRYAERYVVGPGFDKVSDPKLQYQLIDYAVNSGVAIAVQKLQTILGVPVDGVFGPLTQDMLAKADSREVNNQLVVARVKMIGKIVQQHPAQLQFLGGWLERSLSFVY